MAIYHQNKLIAGSGGSSTSISVDTYYSSGNKIATISVDNVAKDIYSPNGPTPSDAKITIYQGSTEKGSFTLNQPLEQTINLDTVPSVGAGTITINQGSIEKGTFNVNQIDNTIINLDAPSSYNLPVATSEILGGVKIGPNLAITEDGVLSAASGSSQNSFYSPLWDKRIDKTDDAKTAEGLTISSIGYVFFDDINNSEIQTYETIGNINNFRVYASARSNEWANVNSMLIPVTTGDKITTTGTYNTNFKVYYIPSKQSSPDIKPGDYWEFTNGEHTTLRLTSGIYELMMTGAGGYGDSLHGEYTWIGGGSAAAFKGKIKINSTINTELSVGTVNGAQGRWSGNSNIFGITCGGGRSGGQGPVDGLPGTIATSLNDNIEIFGIPEISSNGIRGYGRNHVALNNGATSMLFPSTYTYGAGGSGSTSDDHGHGGYIYLKYIGLIATNIISGPMTSNGIPYIDDFAVGTGSGTIYNDAYYAFNGYDENANYTGYCEGNDDYSGTYYMYFKNKTRITNFSWRPWNTVHTPFAFSSFNLYGSNDNGVTYESLGTYSNDLVWTNTYPRQYTILSGVADFYTTYKFELSNMRGELHSGFTAGFSQAQIQCQTIKS